MDGPYQRMADRINAIPEGMCLKISRREIQDLPRLPPWAELANITMGFERVKESVIGSAYPHLWRFDVDDYTGDITVCRLKQERLRRRYIVPSGSVNLETKNEG